MSGPDLPSLFIELNENGSKGDYNKAIKVADKILREDKNNVKAIHYKVVCLIWLRHIDEALQVIENSDSNVRKEVQYEHAYCLYLKDRPLESLEIMKGMKESNEVKELKGQNEYLVGDVEQAYSTYVDVMKNSLDENEEKREANLAAIVASLKVSGCRVNGDIPDILDDIVSSVDIVALESSCWSLSSKTKYIKKAITRADGTHLKEEKKKKKRKRKRILPKNYDPSVDPDPERWLPRWQRSSTKKKTDKRKSARDALTKGTQGAAAYDSVTTTESFATKSSPKPGSTNPTPNPRQTKPAGKPNKGRKGKGKK